MKNSKVLIGISAGVSILALSAIAFSRGTHAQIMKAEHVNNGRVHMITLLNPGDSDLAGNISDELQAHPNRTLSAAVARPNGRVSVIFIGD